MTGAQRFLRPTAFRLGFLTGLGLCLLAIAAIWGLSFAGPRYDAHVLANGADVSRAGGRSVLVRDGRDTVFAARCNGACDDLWYGHGVGGETSVAVEVRDAQGLCVACDTGTYMTGAFPYAVERWTLAGPRLNVVSKTVTP